MLGAGKKTKQTNKAIGPGEFCHKLERFIMKLVRIREDLKE